MKIKIKRKKIDKKTSNRKTKVIIGLPDSIETELVQANEIKHYELFHGLLTLFLPIAAGFWTAYFTGNKGDGILFSALAFLGASILFFVLAAIRRIKLFRGSVKKTAYLDSFGGKN